MALSWAVAVEADCLGASRSHEHQRGHESVWKMIALLYLTVQVVELATVLLYLRHNRARVRAFSITKIVKI